MVRILQFNERVEKQKAKLINPIVLAFVGDAVYSLFWREKMAISIDAKSGKLSALTSQFVNAKAQAHLADEMLEIFTEEELDIYKRARNSKKPSRAKHSSVSEYNKSTGLEAVFGYLYLIGDIDRLNYLFSIGEKS